MSEEQNPYEAPHDSERPQPMLGRIVRWIGSNVFLVAFVLMLLYILSFAMSRNQRATAMNAPMPITPRRRRYQFSMRTFFVLVTLVCVGFGWWVHRSREWIRQRHDLLRSGFGTMDASMNSNRPLAPGGLWLFGERGVATIWSDEPNDRFEEMRDAFPEANVSRRPGFGGSFPIGQSAGM